MLKFLFVLFIMLMVLIISYRVTKKNKTILKLPRTLSIISKITAILCLVIALTMIADILLPKDTLDVQVIKSSNSNTVDFGIYSEELNEVAYNTLKDNEKVKIEVSKIYDEIKEISLIEKNNEVLTFPTVDNYAFLFMIVLFLLPIFIFVKNIFPKIINEFVYYLLNISSLVLGFVGIILIIKFYLVHVLHIIERM
ncbi:hypothetical protein KPL40_15785 [Clostridium gasigenes]|uniref:hypothetical protein n=1 Tax=Clostridium gasigenes TaxID=94869 RepID=UPI001C0BEF62|nr:hypothetical protein [Clostridium gasigenes]MBU3133890.1 hypothetical protein [Clostridium gasigenes]